MLIELNPQMVVKFVDTLFLERFQITEDQLLFKRFEDILHPDVPQEAIYDFFISVNNGWKHTSILKLHCQQCDMWLNYKSTVCLKDGALVSVTLELFDVDDNLKGITQGVFDELSHPK